MIRQLHFKFVLRALSVLAIGVFLGRCGIGAYPLGTPESEGAGVGTSTIVFAGITSIDSIETDSVRVNWDAVGNIQRYQLFNTTQVDAPVLVARIDSSKTSYTVTGLTPSTLYKFRVKIVDLNDRTDSNLNDVSVTTLASGDTSELPQTSSLKLWVKAGAGIEKDGSDGVSTWRDQSGNSNDLVQVDASVTPLWVNGIVNGRPIVRFNGSFDALGNRTFSFSGGPHMIFFVLLGRNQNAINPVFSGDDFNSLAYGFDTVPNVVLSNGGSSSAGFVDNLFQMERFHVLVVSSSGISGGNASADGWLNGDRLVGTPSLGSLSNSSGSRMGGSASGSFAAMDMAECILYDAQLSNTDRQSVEDYLGNRYQITINH